MNFGISGYGLGQELLTFLEYTRRFHPDYVLVFCAGYYMWRTVDKKAGGGFPGMKENRLWVRPSFHLEGDHLVLEPAQDYEEFKEKQQLVMRNVFGGSRIARRPGQLFLWSFLEESWRTGGHWIGALLRGGQAKRPILKIFRDPSQEVLALNLKILEKLADASDQERCHMIVLDVSPYFDAGTTLPKSLRRLASTRGLGYIPLGDELLATERRGQKVQLPIDTHFTELGNRIAADVFYKWFASQRAVAP